MGMIKEFKEFAVRGNVVDLAVGVIIGAAFTAIVNSLVNDIIMPPLGMVSGNADFANKFVVLREGVPPGPYASLDVAKKAGATTLNYGIFINNIVTFVLVAFAVFLMVKAVNKLRRKTEEPEPGPTTKECQFCKQAIPATAVRCMFCTSELT